MGTRVTVLNSGAKVGEKQNTSKAFCPAGIMVGMIGMETLTIYR